MKKIALLLIAALALFNSCKIETSKDLGPETTRTVTVREFKNLTISICTDVEYIPSDTFSVTITAPEKSLDRILLNVSDSTLSIEESTLKEEKGVTWIINNSGYTASKIVVRAPYLTCVNLAGSGSFTCTKTIKTPSLALTITGSGEMDVAGIEATNVKAFVAGSGDINAHITRAASTLVNVAGSGDVKLKLTDCGEVTAGVAGSGDIAISGNAQTLKQDTTGSGNIDTDYLKLTK